jgi:hypothetical protein
VLVEAIGKEVASATPPGITADPSLEVGVRMSPAIAFVEHLLMR